MARRRLMAHVERHEWTPVLVELIIDLIVVVVGVFLGVQASNWNDSRRERQASRSYLTRIDEDLAVDIKGLDQHERYWEDSANAGERALRFAEDGTGEDAWEVLNDFFGAGQRWNFATSDATYTELLSAGRLDLIRDMALRKSLADYYIGRRDQTEYLASEESAYRGDIRAIVPYDVQKYLLDNCQSNLRIVFSRHNCPPPHGRIDIARLDRKIAADQKLIGELRTWMTDIRYVRMIGNERRQLAASLAKQVDHALRQGS